MKLANLVGDRFKERPADCVVDSHALMVRGGYIKYVANGIYSSYMPLKRVTRKIEQIMREEMDAIDGQEVTFPVVMPATLWQESGRYSSIGSEMVRFTDRNDSGLVLGMTHEEAAVQLVKDFAKTYARYPFMIYQIQTKFRDEARPRAGLIRVREFTMKDAYSFHTSQEDLEAYYDRAYKAYDKIYARCGVPEVIAVKSDSGMMGGSVSHEFMLLTPIGEDSIAICDECGYSANMEAAPSIIEVERDEVSNEIEKVATPDQESIEDVCRFLNVPFQKSCKAVVYQKNSDDSYVVIFLRGDLEVNETKVTNFIGDNIHPAVITAESGLCAGYMGPFGLDAKCTVLYDSSLKGANNLVAGGNETGFHYTGLDMERDVKDAEFGDFAKIIDGGICPKCGKKHIHIHRGIEVGNIFQLGTKYTESMNMTYVDEKGESHYPIMGCYGIGVGRLAASICEARHDDYGPIWPITIAPWQVHICALRAHNNPEVKAAADKLYNDLLAKGIEVIYDDRKASNGVMFSDADLLGVPYRVIVSPRNLEENAVEVVTRDKSLQEKVNIDNAADTIAEMVRKAIAEMNNVQ